MDLDICFKCQDLSLALDEETGCCEECKFAIKTAPLMKGDELYEKEN